MHKANLEHLHLEAANRGPLKAGSHGILSPSSLQANPCNFIGWGHESWDLPFHKESES